MANWSNPTLTSTYTNFVTEVKDRDVEVALWFEGMSPTNLPTNAKRLNTTTGRFEKWNGSAWVDAVGTFTFPALTVAGATTLSGGTANGVTYLNGSKVLTSGSALTWNGTGLGIGIASAVGNLDVYTAATSIGYVRTANQTLKLTADDSGNRVDIANVAGNPVSFTVGVTEGMRLTSTGLGIGTAAPGVKLEVAGDARLTGANPSFSAVPTSTGFYIDNRGVGKSTIFRVSSASAIDTTAATLDSSGNLGIGTSSPSGKVDAVSNATAAYVARASTTGANQTANALVAFNSDASLYALARYRAVQHIWDYAGTTEGMRLDASGNLSVGTSTAVEKLTVNQGNIYTLRTGGAKLRLADQNNEVSVESLPVGVNSDMVFKTSTTTRMTLDASGNLGLGVTPSAWSGAALELQTGAALYGFADTTNVVQNAYYNAGWKYKATAAAAIAQVARGAHYWFTAPSGTAGTAISFTQAMTLDASGNLGLGVTPSAWNSDYKPMQLGINGSVYGRVATLSHVGISANAFRNAAGSWLYISTSQASRYDQDGSNHYWYTAPSGTAGNAITFTQAMTLNASGNLGVGTSSPATRLHVNSAATDEVARFEGTGNPYISVYDSGTRQLYFGSIGASDVDFWVETNKNLRFATNNTERFRMGPAGQLGIAGANYGTSGQVLVSGGASAAPSWGAPASLSTASGSAPSYSARAWVNFNGSGTVAIRANGNVTSITDDGVGTYTVNMTTALADSNYCTVGTGSLGTAAQYLCVKLSGTLGTGTVQVTTTAQNNGNPTLTDPAIVNVAIFR